MGPVAVECGHVVWQALKINWPEVVEMLSSSKLSFGVPARLGHP
jgi:hypothetical protein